MSPRTDRLVLGIEIALGIVPITIAGGLLSIMGMYFGSVSIAISMAERPPGVPGLWLGILALAAGGLAGIVGLWAIVLVTISRAPPDRRLTRIAVGGSAVGVVTAVVALAQSFGDGRRPAPVLVALLLAPVVVVVHRLPRIVGLLGPERPHRIDGGGAAGG